MKLPWKKKNKSQTETAAPVSENFTEDPHKLMPSPSHYSLVGEAAIATEPVHQNQTIAPDAVSVDSSFSFSSNKFQFKKKLGEGAFGEVQLIEIIDKKLQKHLQQLGFTDERGLLAIKTINLLKPDATADPEQSKAIHADRLKNLIKEGEIGNHLWKSWCASDQPGLPPYNLVSGATMDGTPIIMSKFEGDKQEKYVSGPVNDFIVKLASNNPSNPDLDIFV